ncbi:MAG: DUF5309 family protein [Thermodesulfobacteriota bacterium]
MKISLLQSLDAVVQAESDVLSRIPVDGPVAVPVIRWIEEAQYPSAVTARLTGDTMAFTGYLFGTPVNAGTVPMVIRDGTIIERPGDGCQVKVRCLEGVSAAVSAYGNTSLSDDAEPIEWDIISEVWSDYRDASEARSLDRHVREVGTQIFAETFEIPKTRKHTRYALVACEVEHQITALLGKLRRQLGYAVLRSRPCHDGSQYVWGDKTEDPTMCGLCSWPVLTQNEQPNPNIFVNKQEQALTKADLDGLVRSLWLDEHADYGKGEWAIVCHPSTHRFMQDFDIAHRRVKRGDKGAGFRADEFRAKMGKTFPILSERCMRPGVLVVVNFQGFSYGYYANDFPHRRKMPTQGRYERWLLSFQTYGLVARNPRANIGMIYGLPSE